MSSYAIHQEYLRRREAELRKGKAELGLMTMPEQIAYIHARAHLATLAELHHTQRREAREGE